MSDEKMIKMYRRVYRNPKLVVLLKISGLISVILVALAFAYALFILAFFGEHWRAIELLALAGIPFGAVSIMRRVIDLKRPYEIFLIDELAHLKDRSKSGRSFPSRHVFSAFLIGTLWGMYSSPICAAVILLGVLLAVERVLLGIHFIKDVISGAIIGILSGLIGILIW